MREIRALLSLLEPDNGYQPLIDNAFETLQWMEEHGVLTN